MHAMVTVRVTRSDILLGKRESCSRCAVAIALRRTGYELGDGVSQDGSTACVFLAGGRQVDLPAEVVRFIKRFDSKFRARFDSEFVEPFTFQLPDLGRCATANLDPEDDA